MPCACTVPGSGPNWVPVCLPLQLLDQELKHELLAHYPAAHSLRHWGEWRLGVALGMLWGTGKCVVRRPPATLPSALQVNFLIFVRVICIVVSKLKANLMCKTDIKCRCVTTGSARHPQPSFRQRWSSRVPSLSLHDLLPPGLHL